MKGGNQQRLCISCGAYREQSALLRFTKRDGHVFLNTKDGRGTYLCKASACIGQALKKNLFRRYFSPAECEEIEALLSEVK